MRYRVFFLAALLFPLLPAFAQGLSKNCASEIMALAAKDGFEAEGFLKELPQSVVKVKAQEKAGATPVIGIFLGPGSDDKLTEAGVTVGCAKSFPESSGEMQALLAEASLMLGVKAAASALSDDGEAGIGSSIDPGIETPKKDHFWLAVTLDLAGAGFMAYGLYKNSEAKDNYDKYKALNSRASQPDIDNAYGKVKVSRGSRNFAYTIGASALALGIGAHIWF